MRRDERHGGHFRWQLTSMTISLCNSLDDFRGVDAMSQAEEEYLKSWVAMLGDRSNVDDGGVSKQSTRAAFLSISIPL